MLNQIFQLLHLYNALHLKIQRTAKQYTLVVPIILLSATNANMVLHLLVKALVDVGPTKSGLVKRLSAEVSLHFHL